MRNNKIKLWIILMFFIIILLMMIGLLMIDFSSFYDCIDGEKSSYYNGFQILRHYNFGFFFSHYTNYICSLANDKNYFELLKLQVGIIFLIILIPFLIFISCIVSVFIVSFKKVKNIDKNNNFWDAITNDEIINNYYIH